MGADDVAGSRPSLETILWRQRTYASRATSISSNDTRIPWCRVSLLRL